MTNTIEGLRVNQWGVEATRAAGTLTVDTQPTALDTFTIGSKVFDFVASGANEEGEINVGADLPAAKVNIVAAINGTDGWNAPHPEVTAGAFGSDDVVITARLPGPAGDALETTETFTAGTNVFDATTLGGTTAGAFARGTAVAATSKIAIERLEWGDDDENIYRPGFANGLLIRNRGQATPVQHGSRFNFSDQPMVWEQLMHWLTMAVTGTPVITWETGGAVDVYRWTFTRNPAANPQPLSWTLQRRFTDGSSNIDQRIPYCMLSEFGLSYAQNEHLRMSGSGFGRRFESSAITGALALPAAQIGVSALSTVDVDDSWANLGNTLLAEQVVGWNFSVPTGFMPLTTAEGREDLDWTKHQINGGEVGLGLNLTCLLDPTTYAAELAAAEAGTLRAVQVNVTGNGGRAAAFKMLMTHEKPTLFRIGEQDGQDIVEMSLVETSDGTNFFEAVIDHPTIGVLA